MRSEHGPSGVDEELQITQIGIITIVHQQNDLIVESPACIPIHAGECGALVGDLSEFRLPHLPRYMCRALIRRSQRPGTISGAYVSGFQYMAIRCSQDGMITDFRLYSTEYRQKGYTRDVTKPLFSEKIRKSGQKYSLKNTFCCFKSFWDLCLQRPGTSPYVLEEEGINE